MKQARMNFITSSTPKLRARSEEVEVSMNLGRGAVSARVPPCRLRELGALIRSEADAAGRAVPSGPAVAGSLINRSSSEGKYVICTLLRRACFTTSLYRVPSACRAASLMPPQRSTSNWGSPTQE